MIATFLHLKRVRTLAGAATVLFVAAALSGCTEGYPTDMVYGVRTDPIVTKVPQTPPPSFGAPGQWPFLLPSFEEGKLLEPSKLASAQRQQFDKTLTELFGTPAAPKVARVDGLDEQMLKDLGLVKQEGDEEDPLVAGSRHFRHHCLHCHGLTGDGRGPTSAWVNPHPRDYRPGVFKFTSSGQPSGSRKPRREDLLRVLRQGIEGTSMPSFGLLPEKELQQLASYVIHLSLRGQCEYDVMNDVMTPSDYQKNTSQQDLAYINQRIRENLGGLVADWLNAEGALILPPANRRLLPALVKKDTTTADLNGLNASITRGHKLFLGGEANSSSCISCHRDFGRMPDLRYDAWGTVVRPADLTTGIYRGGRRPIDLYWRIHSGINGVGMPSYPGLSKSDYGGKNLTDQEIEAKIEEARQNIWDLINFVLALPYPHMLPKDVRDAIYPTAPEKPVTASRE